MKKCFKCLQEKDITKFYKHSGMIDRHLGKCKDCTKKDTKDRYNDPTKRPLIRKKLLAYDKTEKGRAIKNRLHMKYYYKYPQKARARDIAKKIPSQPCEVCGADKIERHHSDYSKPLSVMFLCKIHHMEWHNNNKVLNGEAVF